MKASGEHCQSGHIQASNERRTPACSPSRARKTLGARAMTTFSTLTVRLGAPKFLRRS
jgi:hypothetical protein